jgi:hypothetical protein
LIKFKFVGFIISFLMAILVITNGNGSLFRNAFGDSDSVSDSVDEIVESAEEESDDVRDEAKEFEEDTDDEARDGDSEESEDDEDNGDESDDRSEDDSNDAFSDLESEIEDKVREVEDNVEEDDIDDIPGLGEGSGMQIFVSPRERVNEILDQHSDNIENALGDFIDDSFPDFDDQDHPHGFIDFPHSPTLGEEPCPGVEPCPFATIRDTRTCECVDPLEDGGEKNGLQSTNPDGIIEGGLNILFPTGRVGAGPGANNEDFNNLEPGDISGREFTRIDFDMFDPFDTFPGRPGGVGASPGVIDIGPCDGGGLEIVSGTGLCSLKDFISIDLFE